MVKIQKRDGRTEDYERKKLLLSLIRSDSPPDQAERILSNIESWLTTQEGEIIKSSEIKTKILDILKRINPQAARVYKTYRKSQAMR